MRARTLDDRWQNEQTQTYPLSVRFVALIGTEDAFFACRESKTRQRADGEFRDVSTPRHILSPTRIENGDPDIIR